MADNILAQAIADAKAVREMAYAEARNKLEEAFKPHLASMLSNRLREAAELDETLDTSGIGTGITVDEPAPKKPSAAASSSSHIENPGQEVDTFGDGSSEKKPLKEAEDQIDIDTPTGEVDLTTQQGAPTDINMATTPGPQGTDGIADTPDELDLEAIIRELELDTQALGADPTAVPGAAVPAPATVPGAEIPKVESFQDVDAGKKVDGAFDGALKETVAGKSGDGEFHDGKSPKAVDGVNGGKKVSPGQEVTGTKAETMTEGEEINLEEILRELEEGTGAEGSEVEDLKSENAALKASLKEHVKVVNYLRDVLKETNVLNAKLMFTNKLFKNFDLKLEQKTRILETFDRAGSVREVKLVYTTLAESLTGKLNNASRKNTVKTITEGMASKPVGSTAAKSENAQAQILTEGNIQVARWQKIAGIAKK